MDKFSNSKNEATPPQLANKIMSLLLPKRFLDNVLGDLEEEFYQLAEHNIKLANMWYWRQSMETSMICLQKKFGSIGFLGRLNVYLPLAMFVIVVGLISLLSSLEDPAFISSTFWDELLQGKIHTALFSGNFWHNFSSFIGTAELGMFIHPESLLIATINIFVLIYLDIKQSASALKLAVWGYALAFIPYIWSIIHITSNTFDARQIGPIIATGILSLLYMLLPVSYMVHRKLKLQQAEQDRFEQEKMEQERERS